MPLSFFLFAGILADKAGIPRTMRFDPHGYKIPTTHLDADPELHDTIRKNKTFVLLKEKYVGNIAKAMIEVWCMMTGKLCSKT